MENKPEIRIRNVDQSLITVLESIGEEKSLKTTTGTVTFLAENYHRWQKDLKAQKEQIQSLQKELGSYRLKEENFRSTVETFVDDLQRQAMNAKKLLKQFI